MALHKLRVSNQLTSDGSKWTVVSGPSGSQPNGSWTGTGCVPPMTQARCVRSESYSRSYLIILHSALRTFVLAFRERGKPTASPRLCRCVGWNAGIRHHDISHDHIQIHAAEPCGTSHVDTHLTPRRYVTYV